MVPASKPCGSSGLRGESNRTRIETQQPTGEWTAGRSVSEANPTEQGLKRSEEEFKNATIEESQRRIQQNKD